MITDHATSNVPALAHSVLRVMQKQPIHPNGVHIADIARLLDDDAESIE
jgi:hypothetical protein